MIRVVRLEAPLRPPASQLHRDRDRPSSHRGGADGCGMVQTVAVFVCCRPPEENQPGKLVSQAGRVNSWRNFGYLCKVQVWTGHPKVDRTLQQPRRDLLKCHSSAKMSAGSSWTAVPKIGCGNSAMQQGRGNTVTVMTCDAMPGK